MKIVIPIKTCFNDRGVFNFVYKYYMVFKVSSCFWMFDETVSLNSQNWNKRSGNLFESQHPFISLKSGYFVLMPGETRKTFAPF
jgi:hypothetical protein